MPLDDSAPNQAVSAISPKSRNTILQGAIEGIVLVKNLNNTLPLKKPKILSLFGYDAHAPLTNTPEGFNSKQSLGFQSVNVTDEEMQGLFVGIGQLPAAARLGTLLSGGGSPSIVPAYINSPHEAFQQRAAQDGTFLVWDFESQDPVYAVPASDACIVFINEFAAEGSDRSTLADAWSDDLVKNVAAKCPNVSSTCPFALIRTFHGRGLIQHRPSYQSTTPVPGWLTNGLRTQTSPLLSSPTSRDKTQAVRWLKSCMVIKPPQAACRTRLPRTSPTTAICCDP